LELYYNPQRMDDAEIQASFVARQATLDELTAHLSDLALAASNEHLLLLGDRGMGKTTMLLLLRLAVRNGPLSQTWFPLLFPEDPYAINTLDEFWTETALNLAHASSDSALATRLDTLRRDPPDPAAYADSAAEIVRDWCRRNRRRLLLLADNLDRWLLQIHAPQDRVRLAAMLSRDGAFTLAASAAPGAPILRPFVAALKQPLRSWPLPPFDRVHAEELLRRRAAIDGLTGFEERLKLNRPRLNVLHHFTAGNPRHTLAIYPVFASSESLDVRRGLDRLLDQITPYYQATTDALAPQQRKILDALIRHGARTGEALTPTALAGQTALPVNQISVQLGRLASLGLVRDVRLSGRNSYYSAADPLFAVWRMSRFGRDAGRRVELLVEFLTHWYAGGESGEQVESLGDRLRELLARDKPDLDKPIEYKRYIAAAMDRVFRGSGVDRAVQSQVLSALFRSHNWKEAAAILESIKGHSPLAGRLFALRGVARSRTGRKREALEDFDRYLALTPNEDVALDRAEVLIDLRRYYGAIASCEAVLRQSPHHAEARTLLALALALSGRFEDAIAAARSVAAEKPAAVFLQAVSILSEIARQPTGFLRYLLGTGAFDEARVVWGQLLASENNRASLAALAARAMTPANLDFLAAVIPDPPDGPFLYVRRAIECARSLPDPSAAMGKLSADIRPLVEEILHHCHRPAAASKRPE
jgi:tetratricopeptide (TPR) repeat protein